MRTRIALSPPRTPRPTRPQAWHRISRPWSSGPITNHRAACKECGCSQSTRTDSGAEPEQRVIAAVRNPAASCESSQASAAPFGPQQANSRSRLVRPTRAVNEPCDATARSTVDETLPGSRRDAVRRELLRDHAAAAVAREDWRHPRGPTPELPRRAVTRRKRPPLGAQERLGRQSL